MQTFEKYEIIFLKFSSRRYVQIQQHIFWDENLQVEFPRMVWGVYDIDVTVFAVNHQMFKEAWYS